MTVCFVRICQIFAESSQFCKCKFQIFASFLIEKMQIEKTFGIPFWFCFVPPLSSIAVPYLFCIIYFMFIITKSQVIISSQLKSQFYSSYHPRIMHKIMYSTQVIYPMSRVVAHSMIIYLCPFDKKGGGSVLTQHLSTGLHTYICM